MSDKHLTEDYLERDHMVTSWGAEHSTEVERARTLSRFLNHPHATKPVGLQEIDFERAFNTVKDVFERVSEAVKAMVEQINNFTKAHPKLRRIIRKRNARERKRQAIEARQVSRAVRGIEWAPPLLRNGRAAR